MKRTVLALALLALVLPTFAMAGGYKLYGVGPGDGFIYEIDPTDGSTIDGIEMWTENDDLIEGGTALAFDPVNWQFFGVLKLADVRSTRVLAAIDPIGGQANIVGDLGGESFAAIAFADDGTLYGVTGDGANTPESLFEIDTADGSIEFIMSLGMGDDGESLAFNPDDGKLYHGSGHDSDCADEDNGVCFESIDLVTWETELMPWVAGTDLVDEEVGALTYWPENSLFLWTQDHGTPQQWFHVATDGNWANMGETTVQFKGIAFFGREETATEASSFSGVKSLFR